MKQRYTITVANSEIYIVTEEPKEALDTIVGVVDRRIREIHLHSRSCSRVDAALILCLEYCAEKLKLQKKLKQANAEIERLAVLGEAAARENAALEREIETLRASLNMSNMPKSASRRATEFQLGFDELSESNEPLTVITDNESAPEAVAQPAPETEAPEQVSEQTPENNEPQAEIIAEEALTPPEDAPESGKKSARAKKKKVRAMFDMISFDDI